MYIYMYIYVYIYTIYTYGMVIHPILGILFFIGHDIFFPFQVWPAGGLMTIPQENGSHHPTFDHGTHVVTRIV